MGTKFVSVGRESGGFTAGVSYEGALAWYDYTLNSVDKDADGGTKDLVSNGTVTNTKGYNTDWYIDSYKEAGSQDPDPEPDPNPEPEPNPDPVSDHGNTTTVNTVVASNTVNYYGFRKTDKLLRRMGELRNNGEDEQGIWVCVKGAKSGRDSSFENKYTHYELGYDRLDKNNHREKRYEGFSLSYMEGSVEYKEVTGSDKAHDEEIAFYCVSQYTHGHYLDLVARIGMYANRFGVYDTNLNKIHGKNDTYGISASAEYGGKKDYAHGWYVEPQGQATIGHLSGNNYTTSNQIDVNNGSISSAVGRISVNIGKGFTDKKGRRGKFYAKANWLHEFLGSYGIDMVSNAGNRVHAHGNYRDTWFEYGLGFAYQYTKNNFIYVDVEKTSGSNYYKNWAWNVGLRWTFN
ncbi:MAG: autotransporter outer membrane beta-barrel domain-containing protein [Phascolarctobacterium sp.]|nr:autotransporter outer membrane beta-barrel domain-containing protein [Phascolarctobacterium sp.]